MSWKCVSHIDLTRELALYPAEIVGGLKPFLEARHPRGHCARWLATGEGEDLKACFARRDLRVSRHYWLSAVSAAVGKGDGE